MVAYWRCSVKPGVSMAQAIGSRSEQEDAAGVLRVNGCVVLALADGMGGHRGGAEAAKAATDAALAHVRRRPAMLVGITPDKAHRLLSGAVEAACVAVRGLGDGYRAPGCTLQVALVWSDLLYLAHVGDSRAWWCGEGWPVRALVQPHGFGHRLTSHIPAVQQMDVVRMVFEGAGRLVLASDGVDDPLGGDAAAVVGRQLALGSRAQDNATAVVVSIDPYRAIAPLGEMVVVQNNASEVTCAD